MKHFTTFTTLTPVLILALLQMALPAPGVAALPGFSFSIQGENTTGQNITGKNTVKVQIRQTGAGEFEISKVKFKVGESGFEFTEEGLKAEHGPFSFLVGQNIAKADFKSGSIEISSRFTGSTAKNVLEHSWQYTDMRSATDRHVETDMAIRVDGLEITMKNHIDRRYGTWTDLAAKLRFRTTAGLDVKIERKFDGTQSFRFECSGTWAGVKYLFEKGQPPVYGGTARKQKAQLEAHLRIGPFTAGVTNVGSVLQNTGTRSFSDFSVKATSTVMKLEIRTRLNRTSGNSYAFTEPVVRLELRISAQTPHGTLECSIAQDRSVKVSFRIEESEIPHAGTGKLWLTCDIDT